MHDQSLDVVDSNVISGVPVVEAVARDVVRRASVNTDANGRVVIILLMNRCVRASLIRMWLEGCLDKGLEV